MDHPAVRNPLMDLAERAARFRFLVRDWAGQFTGTSGAVLFGARIEVVTIPSRGPGANAHAGRWVHTAWAEQLYDDYLAERRKEMGL